MSLPLQVSAAIQHLRTKSCSADTSPGMMLVPMDSSEAEETCGSTPVVDGDQARELLEHLGELLDPLNTAGHQALAQISLVLESMEVTARNKERELRSMRKSLAKSTKARTALEGELLHTREQWRQDSTLKAERDAAIKRADALEQELCELQEHSRRLTSNLQNEQQRSEQGRKCEQHWRGHCTKLERLLDDAEGRAQAVREQCQAARAKTRTSAHAARSYCAYAEEQETIVGLLMSTPNTGGATSSAPPVESNRSMQKPQTTACAPRQIDGAAERCSASSSTRNDQLAARHGSGSEHALHLHQAQLEKLRAARDELLAVNESWAVCAEESDGDDAAQTPSEILMHRRCTFLREQMRVLLRHLTALESLLDDASEGSRSRSGRSSSRVAVMHGETLAIFNDLEQKLHTLEVQKWDADKELQRCHAQLRDLEFQLKAVQRHRDELLKEAHGPDSLSRTTVPIAARSGHHTAWDLGQSAKPLPPGGDHVGDAASDISTKTPGDQSSTQAGLVQRSSVIDDGFLFGASSGLRLKTSPKCKEKPGRLSAASVSVMPARFSSACPSTLTVGEFVGDGQLPSSSSGAGRSQDKALRPQQSTSTKKSKGGRPSQAGCGAQ